MKRMSDKKWLAGQAVVALLCGAGLMHLAAFFSAGKYGTDRSGAEAAHYPVRERPGGDEASARVVTLLHRLAREPYMELSDEEVALIAGHLDLAQEASSRLLNGVLSPVLRERLWEECVRVSARNWKPGISGALQELMEIAGQAAVGDAERDRVYDGIFEELQRRDPTGWNLMSDVGGGPDAVHLKEYLKHAASQQERLEDALKLLPMIAPGTYRDEVLEAWAKGRGGTAETLRQILAGMTPADATTPAVLTVSDLPAVREFLVGWKDFTPEERQDLLGSIATGMPERERNLVLEFMLLCALETPPKIAVPLLATMTSSAVQEETLGYWLMLGGNVAPGLAAAVAATPDEKGSLKRVAAMLAERAAGKAVPEAEGGK
jgi:hypothetical protein